MLSCHRNRRAESSESGISVVSPSGMHLLLSLIYTIKISIGCRNLLSKRITMGPLAITIIMYFRNGKTALIISPEPG